MPIDDTTYMPCSTSLALQHTFVITTLESTRNADHMEACWSAGLGCIEFPAVAKDALDLPKLVSASYGATKLLPTASRIPRHNLSAGMYAVSLSHRNVYDAILMNQWPCALIFENDAAFRKDFVPRFRSLSLPQAFDVLKLEYCGFESDVVDAQPRVMHGQGGWCSAAYLITMDGAKLLRSLQTPVWLQSDGAFRVLDYRNNRALNATLERLAADGHEQAGHKRYTSQLRPIRIYHVVPPLVWQRGAWSFSEKDG